MPRADTSPNSNASKSIQPSAPLVYSPTARAFHWTVALLVLITAPIGFIMADRGARNIWDATTNQLYSSHKLIGLIILALMIARLTYRLLHGAPASEPSLTSAQKGVSHAVHWTLYLLLIAVPVGGYLGISYYPALDVFGFKVPGLVTPNEAMAKEVFKMHALGALVLLGLIGLHLAGSAYHALVKCDGVLARMWPGSGGGK